MNSIAQQQIDRECISEAVRITGYKCRQP